MYSQSDDGFYWSEPKCIIQKGTMRHYFYRPCIMVSNDSIYCLYGTVDYDNVWKVAMSTFSCKEFPEHISSDNANDFNAFKTFIIGSIKRILRAISFMKLTLLSVIIAIILGFILRSRKICSSWVMIWIVLILMNISEFVNIFQSCIYLLSTGIVSLFSSLVSLGLQGLENN